jgi:Tol biopolymer transport system component
LKDSPDFAFWTIFVSRFENGHWTEPQVAPFSGQYRDADPFMTADGAHLYFISDRPVPGKSHHDLDIWVMDKTSSGWSEPHNLGIPVNSDGQEWFPTVASDGTLYFGSDRPGGQGKTDLYRCRLVSGKYAQPENLGSPVNTERDEYEPRISPDQSFLIFMADNRDGRGDSDLYISYQQKGQWTDPVSLEADINSTASEYSPVISPDGKYFFWTSTRNQFAKGVSAQMTTKEYLRKIRSAGNGLGDIYQIDLKALHIRR